MRALLATVTVVAVTTAGLGLAAGTAQAKPPPVAPVANTNQTIGFAADAGTYTTKIDFLSTTFTIPEFGDRGVFTNFGKTLKMTIKSSSVQDRGCMFTGTYDAAKVAYSGTYTCKTETNTFSVTATQPTG